MPNEITSPRWIYPLVNSTMDKRGPRTQTPAGVSYEEVGIDGSQGGGSRPMFGFKFVKELLGAVSGNTYIDGFFPVTFRISPSEVAQGYVYRATNGTDYTYYLEYRKVGSVAYTWVGPIDLVGTKAHAGRSMDVRVVGKYVWVFVEGVEPFMFYYDAGSGGDLIEVVTDTGPGPSPHFTSEDVTIIANEVDSGNAVFNPLLAGVDQYTTTAVLAKSSPPTDDVTASAKLFVLQLNGDDVTWVAPLKGPDSTWVNSSAGAPTERYWTDYKGLIASTGDPYAANPKPFNQATVPTDQRHLWQSGYAGCTENANSDGTQPEYSFILQFFDSRTGRKSNYSDAVNRAFLLPANALGYGGYALDSSNRPVGFPLVEIVYDSDRWDRVFVWRTVRNSAVFSLDAIITLADYLLEDQSLMTGNWKVAGYMYDLTDAELGSVQSLVDFNVADNEMPTAGAAIFHEGVMLFGNLSSLDEKSGSVGVVRWSDPFAVSIEQVSADNVYYLQQQDDEVVRFCYLGPNVVGFSRQGVYLFRKETYFIKGFPLHVGFGVVHERAACEVGSIVYFTTEFGVKTLDAAGTMRDVSVVDNKILKEWVGDLAQVRMAYDAASSVICILKGNAGRACGGQASDKDPRNEMVMLWMNTSRMTEFHDANFSHVIEGDVHTDPTDASTPLQRRACFLQEVQKADDSFAWRVYVLDYRRERDFNGTMPVTLGSSRALVASTTFLSGEELEIKLPYTASGYEEGSVVYVLTGTKAGSWSRLRHILPVAGIHTVPRLVLQDPANLYGVAKNDKLAISPIYTRWVGAQIGLQDPQGQPFGAEDFFRMRRVETIGCSFSDVSDPNGDGRFFGLVYEGITDTVKERSAPVGTDDTTFASLTDGAGIIYAAFGGRSSGGAKGIRGAALYPGIEVFYPGVDFNLLAVRVTGAIEAKDREARPS